VEEIIYEDRLLAIIVSSRFNQPGIHFFTPNELSQQLAYMSHPTGRIIPPHVHNPVVRKGRLRVDFYSSEQHYIDSRILVAGDVILLITGGHGFEVIEDLEMVEIKQGPYVGEQDKTRFVGIDAAQAKVVEGVPL
jgi:mannose-6-phosphate isomerase-like protein (cupin superfamily)